MNLAKEQHTILCKSQKKWDGDPGNEYTIVQVQKQGPYTQSQKSLRHYKARQVKCEVRSMFIIFFDIRGIVHKEFVLAVQTVNSSYYFDVL
jgi:hypothetical protein